ncbi:MAG: hypothetical protein JXA66_03080 [Oligoflexia bacterium]|nr:hypothetical protein [Oligoflexia bacterium]
MLILLPCLSCVVNVPDSEKGLHPVAAPRGRVVRVAYNMPGDAKTFHVIDQGSIPIWCNMGVELKEHLKEFKDLFMRSEPYFTGRTVIACYAGAVTGMPDFADTVDGQGTATDKKTADRVFIHTGKAGSLNGTFAGLVLDLPPEILFTGYFRLYREYCMEARASCCLSRSGSRMVFIVYLNGITAAEEIEEGLGRIISTLNDGNAAIESAIADYNIFNSFLVDDCTFNRWYYDALMLGIKSPERFLHSPAWKIKADRAPIREIGLSIHGSDTDENGAEYRELRQRLLMLTVDDESPTSKSVR